MARPSGRTVVHLKCEHCGIDVQRFKGQERPHTFCSQRCYLASDYHTETVRAANMARNPDPWTTQPCANCGTAVRRHTSRKPQRFFCDRRCQVVWQRSNYTRYITDHGYVLIYVGKGVAGATKSGHVMEHRKVMQDILGRPLTESENVHHVNGVRDDNRPENLELWSRSQPKGQRVEDKIRWAREFLALYEKD